MATTLTAWSVTGSGQLFSGATRLRGYQIATSGAASGIIQIRDGSATGPIRATIYLPASATAAFTHNLPDMGVRFLSSMHCVVSGGGAIVGLTAYVG